MASDQTGTADVVVVGGGLAGLEAALALRACGVPDVAVVDGAASSRVARWRSTTPPHYPDAAPQHRRLGGRSLAWHGVTVRLEDWALADWPVSVATALTDGADGGLYAETEADLTAWAGWPLDAPRERDAALLARLRELTGAGWAPVPRAVRGDGRAYTPLRRWQGHGQGRVVGGAAVAVVVAGGRARGVQVGARRYPAGSVLVTAGTLETTRLVAQARGPTQRRYPGLHDHLVEGLLVRLPPDALPAPAFARRPADAAGRCALFARTHPDPAGVLLDLWTMGEQRSSPAGGVVFDRPGAPPWPTRVEAGLGPGDDDVLAAGRAALRAVWQALTRGGGAPVRSAPQWSAFLAAAHPFPAAREQAAALPVGGAVGYGWPLGSVDHEGGTLPYGGPLDESGQVRDVPGLWVAGPAAFPRPGAANPSLTTLALARRTARAIAAEATG